MNALAEPRPQPSELAPRQEQAIRALQQFRLSDATIGTNPVLKAAAPLLGLTILLRRLPRVDDVGALLARCRENVADFERALEEQGMENASIMAARYTLCTMLDETVLSQDWGAESLWSTNPLLSAFHNETWGGEKFFAILERVQDEPERFTDLLEFMYYCQAIGFEGQYHLQANGAQILTDLLARSQRILQEQSPGLTGPVFHTGSDPISRPVTIGRRMPVWGAGVIGLVILGLAFLTFDARLSSEIATLSLEMQKLADINSGE
jgi:type VI secretion system protein ImpK